MDWIYRGRKVTSVEDVPPTAVGFIYVMTVPATGHKYVGKKFLYGYQNKTLPGKVRKLKVVKDSNWLKYYSSNEQLVDLHRMGEPIDREIIEYAYTKAELTYLECRYMFMWDVIRDPLYLNSNILGKFYRGRV